MAAARYPVRRNHHGRLGLGVMETSLALSVIVGLLFVAVRVMSLGVPANLNQAHETTTTVVKTEALQIAPDSSETKTP